MPAVHHGRGLRPSRTIEKRSPSPVFDEKEKGPRPSATPCVRFRIGVSVMLRTPMATTSKTRANLSSMQPPLIGNSGNNSNDREQTPLEREIARLKMFVKTRDEHIQVLMDKLRGTERWATLDKMRLSMYETARIRGAEIERRLLYEDLMARDALVDQLQDMLCSIRESGRPFS